MNVSERVSLSLFLNGFLKLFCEINTRLISQTEQHPKHICRSEERRVGKEC